MCPFPRAPLSVLLSGFAEEKEVLFYFCPRGLRKVGCGVQGGNGYLRGNCRAAAVGDHLFNARGGLDIFMSDVPKQKQKEAGSPMTNDTFYLFLAGEGRNIRHCPNPRAASERNGEREKVRDRIRDAGPSAGLREPR